MKRIASIQDISCLGKCSLTVALPVISAMGVECAIVPTAVLSTHTMFSGFTCKDLSDQLLPIADHWKKENLHFDAIYTGYLASKEQCAEVCEFFDRLKDENTLIFVDPAMADNGKLYPAFSADFPKEMAKVCAKADVIVPNLTEACLMTDTPYQTEYDESYIRALLKKLLALGTKRAVLTGVSFEAGKLGAMCMDQDGNCYSYFTERLPVSFHGTGDLFSSCCIGAMMRGASLEQALAVAADYTAETIRATLENPDHAWYGVDFEATIPYLIERLEEI